MPCSSGEAKLLFREWLTVFRPQKIMDVGAGAGAYCRIIREVLPDAFVVAVEGYEPYIEQFKLKDIYTYILIKDVRELLMNDHFDLIIFGDVLEHFERQEAIDVWKKMKPWAKFMWASLPIKVAGRAWSLGYNQGEKEYAVNILEKHRYNWDFDEFVKEFGPFLWIAPYKTVAGFMAEGDAK